MAVKAHLKHLRISPRKVRLVVDIIRGMEVDKALEQLDYTSKRSSGPVIKLLKSAIASAEHDFKLERKDLYVSKIIVEEGPTLKRMMPHAMGRSFPIAKRTSHITLILDKKSELPAKEAIEEAKNKISEGKENQKSIIDDKIEKDNK
jgi:large subunit ribosomal protein L22